MQKILVIDDEPAIRDLVEMVLVREGYRVATAADGGSGLALAARFKPHLVVLDLMLPDISGHDVCKEISSRYRTPIIMLTAKNDVVDKVLGLELGADDYITKPFDSRELLARVKALLRRLGDKAMPAGNNIITHHNLEINLTNKTVTKDNKPVALTPREFQLLAVLASNPLRVFSRDELMSKAWGYDYTGDSRSVDIHITRLRKKIEVDSSKPRHIITVYGFGYRFGEA
ncbi:response regulator transcription factor [Desulfofalx alkaliphila]|uniref:response regulator transcription factor n=1 Tax=Desulfofalx alkaliphila TaxID=105483 RepID=UPI0004E0E946|nr:response regulator transcription factor [Desulfofalx alkaliphila]